MTWSYRVFKRPMTLNTGGTRYEFFIAEAFYDDDGTFDGGYSDPDENLFWVEESLEELKKTYEHIAEAFKQPVLEVPIEEPEDE